MPGIKAKRKQLVRKTLMRAKAQGERAAEQRQESPEEYAQTEVQQGIYDVAARTGNTAKSTARMSYRKFRAMQEKRKNLALQGSTQSASKPTEKEKVTVPTQTERREMFKKQRFRQKAIAAKTPAPQAPVPSSATPAPPPYQAQMQQHLKRQHLTREAVRRYLQKQTTATAAGNTAPIVTHAPKLPTISNKQAAVEAISRGVHYIAAKIKALLSQTVRRAAQSLLALLGAGGVVLVLAMVIGAAAAVIGSPMGILFADESGDPNSIPIAEIVADTNADFGAAINDIVSAHPECSETTITYDYEDGHTWASYWPEVLAIFAVHTNLNSDSDVVVPSSATPAPPPYQAQMQQHLKRQHLTREAVRRYLQKQTATTAAGNTAPIVTHAPKLPTISSKQATVEAISRGVHYIAAKIKALLSQTVRHAAQSLLALLGAGGVVLLLAMVIGAAAAVIGSPMGILFADESGDPNSIPIAEIVADTNADFGAAVNDIVSAHPECSETTITYDYEDGHTWASYWPEVLAIFAVHTNLNSDSDVVVINAAQMQRIQDTFWAMHEITYEVEEVDTTPEPTEDDPDPEQQTDYILHITVSSKTVDELAELYNFTQDQKDILHQLLSEEMRPSLLALCGGIAVADGELCWPLPGHTYISCHFGEVDAFGNAGHRGTDIPAPEGTPILAAHSGTVLVSGWNDSYGNQVLLDNGAGLSTRYAHMTRTAVTAGEAVTAGQIIGYVGSTGDSTGNHLHFEVMQNGVRMNPLELVFAQ